jgi:hypothetical protein
MFDDDLDAFPDAPAGSGPRRDPRAKLFEIFLRHLLGDWRKYGKAAIAKVREEKPDQYLRIVAAIQPRQFSSEADPLDELTDDELRVLVSAAKEAARRNASRAPAGNSPPAD